METLGEGQFYLIREDVLTESMQKMLEVKQLLASGEETTIQEATKRVGLSRSAYYKYRDTVFPFEEIARERVITVFIQLEDRKGSLATIMQLIAEEKCNVDDSPDDSRSRAREHYAVARRDGNADSDQDVHSPFAGVSIYRLCPFN